MLSLVNFLSEDFMRKQLVRLINDPVLRTKTRPLVEADVSALSELLTMMFEVMKDERGIGLAANQVGLDVSLFVLGINGLHETFINPEILSASDLVDFDEGCLSIPGVVAKTKRYNKVTLRWNDASDPLSKPHEETFEGIKAIAIQHEMDHLNGKLFVDQFGPVKRSMLLDKHKKYMKTVSRS
jgi:peptide deformylase